MPLSSSYCKMQESNFDALFMLLETKSDFLLKLHQCSINYPDPFKWLCSGNFPYSWLQMTKISNWTQKSHYSYFDQQDAGCLQSLFIQKELYHGKSESVDLKFRETTVSYLLYGLSFPLCTFCKSMSHVIVKVFTSCPPPPDKMLL